MKLKSYQCFLPSWNVYRTCFPFIPRSLEQAYNAFCLERIIAIKNNPAMIISNWCRFFKLKRFLLFWTSLMKRLLNGSCGFLHFTHLNKFVEKYSQSCLEVHFYENVLFLEKFNKFFISIRIPDCFNIFTGCSIFTV